MSAELDQKIAVLVASLLDTHSEDSLLVRRLWSDRAKLVMAMQEIRDWNQGHDEALSVARLLILAENALMDAGETE